MQTKINLFMKKIATFFILCVAVMAISCSSDDGPSEPVDTTVTFTAVKTLMEDNCLACHLDPPINGAPIALITLEEVKDAVENRGLITRIASGTMPPGNLPKLSDAEVQLVRDWQAGDFKE